MIKILNIHDKDFETEFNTLLARANTDMDSIIPEVLKTLQDIKQRGEDALLDIVRKYDSWNPQSFNDLKIAEEDTFNAYKNLDSKTKDALQIAHDRIVYIPREKCPKRLYLS